jgi:cytochrome P450
MHIDSSYLITRRTRIDLPPTAPLPKTLQTLGCRLRPLEYLEWCRRHIGPRFTVDPVSMPPLVFLSDPSDIRAVFSAPPTVLHPGVGAAITEPLFRSSFILLEEDARLNIREAVIPALRHSAIEAYADMITELARCAVSSWPLETPVPLHPRLACLTLTVMLSTIFGEGNKLIPALRDRMLAMLAIAPSLVLQQPLLRHLPGWRSIWSRFIRERARVDLLLTQLIAAHRLTPSGHGGVLNLLLTTTRLDGADMSTTELRDNLMGIIVAGYETTASALAWAFQLIAHHPRVQETLAAEIDAGDGEEYLQATVDEVLRHRPVFLFAVPRAVTQSIEIGGFTYWPPAHLLCCTYLVHHDPALFVDPHEFRPERFLGSSSRGAPTWLPWGGGRQRCPGRHLALLELRVVLRTALSRLQVSPVTPELERARWRSALVTPHAGSTIVLHKRTHKYRRKAASTPKIVDY